MALDSENYPFKAASQIAASGLDVDELLAQNPETVARARAMGIPFPASPGLVSGNPIATAALATPAAANIPSAAGTAASQTPKPTTPPPQVPAQSSDSDYAPFKAFGSNLAAQSQVPANNAATTPGETPATPSVPAAVSPSGTAEDPNQAGVQRAGTMAEDFAQKLASSPTEAQLEAPIQAKRTLPPQEYDPAHPEYRPTAGRRILRGVVGGLEGLTRHGIFGAALGAIDPEAVGATPYSAPTRQFSIAAQKQQAEQAALDKQQAVTEKSFTDDTARAKDIITSINDIGKNYAAGQTAQSREDVATARKQTADVQGQLADIKQQVADFQSQGKTPTTYEATVAAAHLEKDPVKAAALEAAAKEMAATEVKKFRSVAGAGGSTFRQSLIDAATAEVQALQDKYHYDPRRNQYVNPDNPNDILDPNEFTDKKNEIATKLDAQLGAKKMDKLGVRFDPADAGANKPSGRAVRQQPANKPKPPTPTAPPPQGAVDMALGSDGQYHYRDGSKKDLGVVK